MNQIVFSNLSDALHLLRVDWVAGDVGEVGELHVEAAELGKDARTAARPPKVLGDLQQSQSYISNFKSKGNMQY